MMRVLLLAALASLCTASSATVKYAAAAKHYTANSKPVHSGDYYIQNVGTGQRLTFQQSGGEQIYPAHGKGSLMKIIRSGNGRYITLTPKESDKKCGSAQWDFILDGGTDWAMALYGCVVDIYKRSAPPKRSSFPHPQLEARGGATAAQAAAMGPMNHAKQYWLMVPAEESHSYYILASDHITNMPTRALANGIRKARVNDHTKYTTLDVLDTKDKTQMWRFYDSHNRLVT